MLAPPSWASMSNANWPARDLPVVADRATPETAAVFAVKGIAARRADIEAGPVVRRGTGGAFV